MALFCPYFDFDRSLLVFDNPFCVGFSPCPHTQSAVLWSRRSGLNGRPAGCECEQDDFKKARCFKWFPRFLFEYQGVREFQQLY